MNARNKSDRYTLCQFWSYPIGATRPIMLLTMLPLVDSDNVFIPGEIALTPFTIKKGMKLDKVYWTLVDPATNIPKGYNIEACNKAREFGLPSHSDHFHGEKLQNYEEMVERMETFIKENSQPAFLDGVEHGTYFIFCEKEVVPRYALGMDWLYSIAGKGKFPHKILPIETVLVVLSFGGCERVADRKEGPPMLKKFPQVLDSFNNVVDKVVRTRGEGSFCSKDVEEATVRKLLTTFGGSVANTHSSMYSSLGGETERLASTKFLEHPNAFLGAFLYEDQVTRYLNHMDFIWMKHLACEYHRDEGTEEDLRMGKKSPMKMKMITAKSPSHQMQKCAKSNAARIIFLVLDVMLVNYGIRPNPDRHFPVARD